MAGSEAKVVLGACTQLVLAKKLVQKLVLFFFSNRMLEHYLQPLMAQIGAPEVHCDEIQDSNSHGSKHI